ncbi:hypothetical protein FM119_05315 [Mycetocola reblochoni REB411]|uniref:Uncharacterized protein n=1 Tax=Mycetocola reblochoni REB411 TaxID=1255698 RepID=A0A1R4J4C7_9MICO|nr:hypothetical protein FM119_05315 [Mycetocola reblochoni REB411]
MLLLSWCGVHRRGRLMMQSIGGAQKRRPLPTACREGTAGPAVACYLT